MMGIGFIELAILASIVVVGLGFVAFVVYFIKKDRLG